MALPNPVKDLKRPDLSKGTWRGYVVDNQDPEKRQRVKVRIPQLHRDISDEDLPWSMPSNTGQAHSGSGVGAVDVANEGALVEVWFEEDDPHNPRYGGSPPVDNMHEDNEILGEDYPHTNGQVDSAGNKWTVNKLRNEVLFQHKSGSSAFYDGAGNIVMHAAGKLTLVGSQGVDVVSSSGIRVHGGGPGVDIKGGPVNLNSSSASATASAPAARSTPQVQSRRGQTSL